MDVPEHVDDTAACELHRLALRLAEGKHAERKRQVRLVARHREHAHRPCGAPDDAAEHGRPCSLDLDLDESWELVPAVHGWDVDRHDLIRVGVVEAVGHSHVTGRLDRLVVTRRPGTLPVIVRALEHEAGARERRGIRGVLLVAPLDQHHAHVERERRNDQQGDNPACEQDEDLTSFDGPTSC